MAKKTTKQYVPPTLEQIIERGLKEERGNHIPSPPSRRRFQIGDMVSYGHHPNALIVGIYDEGKYYQLKTWGMYPQYHTEVYKEEIRIINWLDIVPLVPNQIDIPSLIVDNNIRLDYMNMSIDSLISVFYSGGIDMNPPYQRDYVWAEEDNLSLIDSIFSNRTIGTHVLVWLPSGYKYYYEVLDGKQRINAICSFYQDGFQYKGKFFSELSYRDQWHFTNHMFPRAEIKESREGEVPLEKKINIFLHVNSCGRIMDENHLNKVKAMLME